MDTSSKYTIQAPIMISYIFKTFLFAMILCYIVALPAIAYLAGHSFQPYLLNSDAVYLPVFFSNIIGASGSIHSWHSPSAPFWFPDYILFFIAY
ncbi:MAG: hypothetical protein Q8R79_04145, partial [Legionellaceae bacterium]|nr:hypothetical protein [Legionellaceae bacterium]